MAILKEFDSKTLPGMSKVDFAKMTGIPFSTLKTDSRLSKKLRKRLKTVDLQHKKMRMRERKFLKWKKFCPSLFIRLVRRTFQ